MYIHMMKGVRIRIFALLMVVCCFCVAWADDVVVITDTLAQQSNGQVTINQPEALRERLKRKNIAEEETTDEDVKVAGYRIQVFSDNNQRTAKSQAQLREKNILAQFPDMKVYITYKSPLWRVRVGDFRTRAEAEHVMLEIKEALPSYAGEMMVVVDNINLQKDEF